MAAISVHFIDRCRLRELGVRSVHSASQMFFKKAEVSPSWRMPFYNTSNCGIKGRPCTGSNGKGLINTALCKACCCWPSAKRSFTGRMGGHGPRQPTQVQYRWGLTDRLPSLSTGRMDFVDGCGGHAIASVVFSPSILRPTRVSGLQRARLHFQTRQTLSSRSLCSVLA